MIEQGLIVLGDIALAIWNVTAQMSGFLLLGFLVAGLLSVFIDPLWLERHLGGRGVGPVFRASLFGVPLPLCSCGVIPVAAGLRSHGASKGAVTAFLLSTPQTGVDSIMITYTMLGPLFAIFRPLMALLTGILGGTLVQASDDEKSTGLDLSKSASKHKPTGFFPRVKAALDYGLVTLPGDIGKPLLIGVLIAGFLGAVIPNDLLAPFLGQGPLSIALMMIVGIPLYVCATASVPLAVGFILLGASPGAALAFLIAGPATNAATITTINRVLGKKTTLIYLGAVAASAFAGGLLLDLLMTWAEATMPLLTPEVHQHGKPSWLDQFSSLVLIVVMTRAWWLSRQRHCGCEGEENGTCTSEGNDSLTPQSMNLNIEGMNCSHCSNSVQRTLSEMAGVTGVQVFLDDKQAVIKGENLDSEALVKAVNGLGFKANLKD
ncbi:MAG: permease [bacterium]|nr:permease [bacterium]